MPPVQLSLLRPQVSALMGHYADQERFMHTLQLLLEKYSEKPSPTNTWLRSDPGMLAYYLPAIVEKELENGLDMLASEHPLEAIWLAERMWAMERFEPKRLAIFTLARLKTPNQVVIIQHAVEWTKAGLSESLINVIIQEASQKLEVLQSQEWQALVQSWIEKEDKASQRVGIRAVIEMLENRAFQDLPMVYKLVTPLYRAPRIALQRLTNELTRKLIGRSQAETAAFLVNVSRAGASTAAQALVRKSVGLFDPFFQQEILNVIGKDSR